MRFHNVQILRIVAAAAVVVAHLGYYAEHQFRFNDSITAALRVGTWQQFPVPLFFAVSGFVLTHAAQSAGSGRFLLARAVRLYPGYWMAALGVVGGMHLTGETGGLSFGTQLKYLGWTLRPHDRGGVLYVLGIEWSLVYEAVLSIWLGAVAGLFGARRGLPIAAAIWLSVLAVRVAFWPGYGMASADDVLPDWRTAFLAAANVPFLLGVLTYQVRNVGRSVRWPVLGLLAVYVTTVPGRCDSLEQLWCVYGPASAVAVWLAAHFRQASSENWLVVAGGWSYGLYLVHVPVITGVFGLLIGTGVLIGSWVGVGFAGVLAMALGLLFGKFESRLHARLRPVARARGSDLMPWMTVIGGRAAWAVRPLRFLRWRAPSR